MASNWASMVFCISSCDLLQDLLALLRPAHSSFLMSILMLRYTWREDQDDLPRRGRVHIAAVGLAHDAGPVHALYLAEGGKQPCRPYDRAFGLSEYDAVFLEAFREARRMVATPKTRRVSDILPVL